MWETTKRWTARIEPFVVWGIIALAMVVFLTSPWRRSCEVEAKVEAAGYAVIANRCQKVATLCAGVGQKLLDIHERVLNEGGTGR